MTFEGTHSTASTVVSKFTSIAVVPMLLLEFFLSLGISTVFLWSLHISRIIVFLLKIILFESIDMIILLLIRVKVVAL